MVYADFDFYQTQYHGIIITDSGEYTYFAERASDELAPFANRIPNTEEAQTALKRCSCRVADILYGDYKSSKNGQKVASESVSGYYSVSYTINDYAQVRRMVNSAIVLYIGAYVIGSKPVII